MIGVAGDKPKELRQTYAGAFADYRRCLPDMIAFDLHYRAAAFALLGPLTTWLLTAFIQRTGQAAISNEDIVLFLLSDRSRFMTGQTLVASGGRVMLP